MKKLSKIKKIFSILFVLGLLTSSCVLANFEEMVIASDKQSINEQKTVENLKGRVEQTEIIQKEKKNVDENKTEKEKRYEEKNRIYKLILKEFLSADSNFDISKLSEAELRDRLMILKYLFESIEDKNDKIQERIEKNWAKLNISDDQITMLTYTIEKMHTYLLTGQYNHELDKQIGEIAIEFTKKLNPVYPKNAKEWKQSAELSRESTKEITSLIAASKQG